MFRFVFSFLLLAAPVQAQVELGAYPAFQTRHGMLSVTQADQFQQVLTWNGQPLDIGDFRLSIAGAWALPDSEFDWVLIEANHGGNMCPGTWFLGKVDALGIAVSERFGECVGGRIDDLRIYPDRIEVDLPHPDIAVDMQTVAYDGWSLQVTLAQPVLGEGQAAASDPRQWIGQHPISPLRDPNEQARFLAIMGEENFRLMVRQIGGPGAPAVERDGWVLGAACMAHQCNTHAAVWGIRLADGQAAAVLLENGGAFRQFGLASDPIFARFLSENAF